MRVDRMDGDSKVRSDGQLGSVVENPADDLNLAFGETKTAGDLLPRLRGEENRVWARLADWFFPGPAGIGNSPHVINL